MAKPADMDDCVPAGWHSVTPRIVAHNADALVEFLLHVFEGTAGERSTSAPTIIRIGNSNVMISEVGIRGPNRAFLYVYVRDVDATYRRALERGASSIEEPFDTPYGDRRCMVEDQWGNTWQIAVHLADRSVT